MCQQTTNQEDTMCATATVMPVFQFSGEDNVGVVLKAGHTACYLLP